MTTKAILSIGLAGTIATIPLVQTVAMAKTAVEINKIAKSITVKIADAKNQGSGVIVARQGDIYTVVTAAHVLDRQNAFYEISAPDGKRYPIVIGSIRRPSAEIDLAVVQFRSSADYELAKMGDCNTLTEGMEVYVAGFPAATAAITEGVYVFREGKVSANSQKKFDRGYSLIYSNNTLPGMSGGAVLNHDGELVAIHGQGDREKGTDDKPGAKTGFNLGIPINLFASMVKDLGIELTQKVAQAPKQTEPKADDYFVTARQKEENKDFAGALADYNRALAIDPSYKSAYNNRGLLKHKRLNDPQGALVDYNRAIEFDPNYAIAYNNRGLLKHDRLQDFQGALADYNRAIALDPNYAIAYNNRGLLKRQKFRAVRTALEDYNRAIVLDPNYAVAYNNRGNLKRQMLDDPQGALADLNRAIELNGQLPNAYYNRAMLKEQKLNDIQGALTDYSRAIELSPNDAHQYENRGILKYTRLNDRPGGIADTKEALKLAKASGNKQIAEKVMQRLQSWEATAAKS